MKSKSTAGAGRRERREFSAECKAEAVRLVAERRARGGTVAEVGREWEVRPDQLRAWARQQRHAQELPGESLEQEVRRLRREVAVLRQEQAFAKKVAVRSTGQCNARGESSTGRLKAKRLARSCVQLQRDRIEIKLGVRRQVGARRDVLA